MSRGSPEKEGGLDRTTSKSGRAATADIRLEQIGKTRAARPFRRALSPADSAAFGLMSMAITRAAPARAAASDNTPEPVPTSATDFPFRSSRSMKPAKYSLVRKYRG